MAPATRTIHIEPESKLNRLLKEADDAPVEIAASGGRYVLTRIRDAADDDASPPQEDAILRIIGIGASEEPTDIARYEREYLAEATDPRSRP